MRPAALVTAFILLVVVGVTAWWQTGSRWRGDQYCFTQPGRVWGTAPMPAGATPSCPASQGVRREVRRGETRVEQFTLSTWQPRALQDALVAEGFTVTRARPDDGIQVEAMLTRAGETVLYTAAHQGEGTFVTLSSSGQR
ncbi:hypothetical protein [Deinococcus sedimenti]|uniref:Uncharacterized protein n=1 Tax=Deinococcus sedimenti TaxID=1867090 RepID=A0ABQ2RYD5_9DEIO|nr:hypothetical protein [Deinococcus sedimenti]GGR80611.1 hypothetical protein GCM10008960_04340 [Deinococcus sedimenti]